MKNEIEQEISKMLAELKDMEEKIQELSMSGIRINEELAATVEILKAQIERSGTK